MAALLARSRCHMAIPLEPSALQQSEITVHSNVPFRVSPKSMISGWLYFML